MLIVDSLLIGGLKFVLSRLAEAVDAEMLDDTALREELLAAQMKLELGELTEEEFEAVEAQILAGMRAARARRHPAEQGPIPGEARFTLESIETALDRDRE
jgi:hypothetical protein